MHPMQRYSVHGLSGNSLPGGESAGHRREVEQLHNVAWRRLYLTLLALCLVFVLAGCNNSDNDSGVDVSQGDENPVDGETTSGDENPDENPGDSQYPETRAAASRFLAQSTFGSTTQSIDALMTQSFGNWIESQAALPENSLRAAFDEAQLQNPESGPSRDWIFEAFWRQAVQADDQLRQRLAFAWSQLFVISLRDGAVAAHPRGVADFYSMLGRNSFGNFRVMLEDVTRHPMMGAYLSHLGNEKGNPATGQVADENFAREIMQLFTLGLHELNPDGTIILDEDGAPLETYTTQDVEGLAKVFTGFSWNGPDTDTGRFQGWISVPDRDVMPMQAYPQFHSTEEKRFLDTVIPESTVPDADGDLGIALDALFVHPNTGPFITTQLIQRLVTSNPSPAYVERVSSVFADNGSGVRGDLYAVTSAILLDQEARDLPLAAKPESGRIREPILRLTHWMRAFNAGASDGRYEILGTDDPATSLGMTVLRSPSVFNFYRPGYTPPNTPVASAGLVSPEMQITHETSVAGYLNSLLNAVVLGTGSSNSVVADYADIASLALDAEVLIEHLNILLHHGSMSTELRGLLIEAVNSLPVNAESTESQENVLIQRAQLAVYLAMASPEYIVLK